MMSIRKGILLCCWLALAACSSEVPDEDKAAGDSEGELYTVSAPAGAGDSPTATVMVDGQTYEVIGDGFCRRIGSRSTDGPEGVLKILIETRDDENMRNDMLLQVSRGEELGLHVDFARYVYGWSGSFTPEEDLSEFDGGRFMFEGPVVGPIAEAPDGDQTTTMRVEIDCPFVEDLTAE